MLVLVFLVFGTLHAAAPPESNRSDHQQPVGQPAVDESRHAEEPRRVLQVVEPWKGQHGKLFKNPCSQAELNKIVPFGFSLQRQKMVFFAIKTV